MNIENIAKFLPIGSVFIILCSSIKLVAFYNLFNITIVDYLEAQEYLTLFIDDLIYYLLIFGTGLVLELFSNKGNITNVDLPSNSRVVDNKIFDNVIYIFIVLIFIFIAITFYRDIPTSDKASYIGVASFGILTSLYFLLTNRFKNFPYLLYIAISIFIYSIMYGYKEGYEILEKKNPKEYSFQFDDKKIQTDSSYQYLGKSKHYIFLYDSNGKTSTILNKKDLNKIEIRNGS